MWTTPCWRLIVLLSQCHCQFGKAPVTHACTENLSILASVLTFAGCPSEFVTRSLSALDQRYAFAVVRCVRRDFCARAKMCVELDA